MNQDEVRKNAFAMPLTSPAYPPGPYRFVAGEYASGNRVVYEKFAGYVPRQEQPNWTAGGKVAHFQVTLKIGFRIVGS